MSKKKKTETDHIAEARAKLLAAALPHVDFDGWTQITLTAAISDSGVDAGLAAQACPRGAIDLAVAFHRDGDMRMQMAFEKIDHSDMRVRDRVTTAVRMRLEEAVPYKEAVRRGMSLFALPANMGEGSRLLWATSDHIWSALGDTSEDGNWYTKRATLAAVYSSTVLFWLGDESGDHADTWAFLDRRIENVMQFEKFKAQVQSNPIGKGLMDFVMNVKKPSDDHKDNFPGYTRQPCSP